MQEKKDKITRIFNEARLHGLCHNQREFAELLDVSAGTVSSALNGSERALTDSLVRKVERWAKDNLPHQQSEPRRPDLTIPAATVELYTAMAKSIDRLTALVERLQATQPAATGYNYAQKKLPS